MSSKRYTEEFKIEAVKQVTDRGHGIYSVASRLGVTHCSLYSWIKRYGNSQIQHATVTDQQAEINRLKAELQRVTEERDILKKATAYFAKESL
jgi:transposase-like protein